MVSFAWGATDDTYTADLSDQDAIAYSYSVEGSAGYGGWSAWSGRKSARLAGLPSGQYRFGEGEGRGRADRRLCQPVLRRRRISRCRRSIRSAHRPTSRCPTAGVWFIPGGWSARGGSPTQRRRPTGGSYVAARHGCGPRLPEKMRLDGSVQLRLLCGGSAPGGCAGYAWLEQRRRVLGRGGLNRDRGVQHPSRPPLEESSAAREEAQALRAAVIVTTRGPFGETQKDSKVVTLRSRT